MYYKMNNKWKSFLSEQTDTEFSSAHDIDNPEAIQDLVSELKEVITRQISGSLSMFAATALSHPGAESDKALREIKRILNGYAENMQSEIQNFLNMNEVTDEPHEYDGDVGIEKETADRG